MLHEMTALRDAFMAHDEAAAVAVVDSLPLRLLNGELDGATPLMVAASYGFLSVLRALLRRGVDVDTVSAFGWTPLVDACARNNLECARLLIEAGADFNKANFLNYTPLFYACMKGYLDLARLLSSYGASRDFPTGATAEALSQRRGFTELASWLELSQHWTPLHHLEQLTAARATTLLRGGADPAASPAEKVPSPLERARALEGGGNAPPGSAAALVLLEARGWALSRENKRLVPAEARARAIAVGCMGRMTFVGECSDALDGRLDAVWNAYVVSRLLHAEYGHVRFAYR